MAPEKTKLKMPGVSRNTDMIGVPTGDEVSPKDRVLALFSGSMSEEMYQVSWYFAVFQFAMEKLWGSPFVLKAQIPSPFALVLQDRIRITLVTRWTLNIALHFPALRAQIILSLLAFKSHFSCHQFQYSFLKKSFYLTYLRF